MRKATYYLGEEAGDLDGWTVDTLAEALRGPLAIIGVDVVATPGTSTRGLVVEDPGDLPEDKLHELVKYIVSHVVADSWDGDRARVVKGFLERPAQH